MTFKEIPAELKALPQWVCYGKAGTQPGDKLYKKPFNPRTGYGAKAGQPDTWATFAEAAAAVESGQYTGIGFEFAEDGGYIGIDFDHCIENGALSEWAMERVEWLNSYTEISPSGTGLHIICKGKLPGKAVKRPQAEMYDRDRYFTITGKPWCTARPLAAPEHAIRRLYEELQADGKKPAPKPTASPMPTPSGDFLGIGLTRDTAFRALWDGKRPNGNESADDMALLNKLAYWCNRETEQMRTAFLQSPHANSKDSEHLQKLEREDYLQNSIEKAARECGRTAAEADAEYKARKRSLPAIHSETVVQDSERSLTGARCKASQFDALPWITEKVKMDRQTGETVTVYTVIPQTLAQFIRENVPIILAREGVEGASILYLYDKGRYVKQDEISMKGCIRSFIPPDLFRSRDVSEVYLDILTSAPHVKISDLNTDERIINFHNGILRLDTMELTPHTPQILSTIQIPCNWNPAARFAENSPFLGYLKDLTAGDPDIQEILLEAMGLALSNVCGYRTKKALFLVGKGDTGKTQIKELISQLVGMENVSAASLRELSARFGLFDVYQKRLVGSNDMSFQTVEDMDKFKQLTGGDVIRLEPKGSNPFPYVFRGFCWFNTNELPRFGGDKGKHVYNRVLPVYCNNVIPQERQDPALLEKMLEEREPICREAVLALKRLIQNRYRFPEPESVQEARRLYEQENNTLLAFLAECCERKDLPVGECVKRSTFKEAYRDWCGANNCAAYRGREIRRILEEEGIQECKYQGEWRFRDLTFSTEFKSELHYYDGTESILASNHPP